MDKTDASAKVSKTQKGKVEVRGSLDRNNELLEQQNAVLQEISGSLKSLTSIASNFFETYCIVNGVTVTFKQADSYTASNDDPVQCVDGDNNSR